MGDVSQSVAAPAADLAARPADSAATRAASRRPEGTGTAASRIPHLTALDGLRGVAVIGAMLYHAGISWIPGGMLGVDVFFVISGFLITSLLLSEHARTGRINLRAFWMRRVRRLLPAVVLVLLFVAITWGLFLHEDVLSLRRDVLFALGYSANWWFAFSGQGYFASFGAPSPVLHLWSLSVEEQFYLIWPIVTVFLLAHRRRVARWAAAGAVLAATATLLQSLAGVWTDRLYYGTDTRAAPLLVGASLGAWYASRPADFKVGKRARILLQIGGLVGAAGYALGAARRRGPLSRAVSRRFPVLAIGIALIIASVSLVPRGLLARALSVRWLRYVGTISYGLYLWHWPIYLWLNHERTGLTGIRLLALRFAVTFAVAATSYRFIESPIRQRRWKLPRPKVTAPLVLASLVGLLFATTSVSAPVATQQAAATTLDGPVSAAAAPPSAAAPRAAPGVRKVLFAGDSLALSLAQGLVADASKYQVQVDNGGLLGCGVARDGPSRFRETLEKQPDFCLTWPQLRAKQVAQYRPDVVALLVGRWEVLDRVYKGRWTHIGDPAFDAYLASELDTAIDVLSASGDRVALLTLPCVKPLERADGSIYPEDQPSRINEFNTLLRQAQQRHPRQAVIVDLYSMVCPGGQFHAKLAGVTIRSADGAHFPGTPIPPVAARLLPVLYRLASAHGG